MKEYCSRPDVKEKRSKINKGKTFSEEHRRRISENHADFKGIKHPRFGSKYNWITNGIKSKCLPLGEKMPDGWKYGKIQNGVVYERKE